MPEPSPSERIRAVLACLRRDATYEEVAIQFGVSPDDVRNWEGEFIAGGSAALCAHEPISDDSAMLIHDLLGPLTSIVGGIEIARTMIADGEPQERILHFLELAHRNGNVLLDTANSLLDIAQLEAGRMTLVRTKLHVTVLFEEVVGMFATSAQAAGITLNTACDPDLPVLLVDTRMIRRALSNLLDNALKFTPSGGEVTLSAAREGDHMIRFSVIDSGPGIPEAYRKRIFERYVQVPDQEGRRRG